MEIISFDKLLLKTAFCCMAADGNIDKREINTLRTLCQTSPLFNNFDFESEINLLIDKINSRGKEFIIYYFGLLEKSVLTEQEELTIIDFAIQTIKADEVIEYSEIKFFKNIRHRLKISDAKIIETFPDIEQYLEEDIVTESFLDRISKQYLDNAILPQFKTINLKDIDETEA